MRFVHILIGSADPRSVNGVNKVVHWLATTQVDLGLASEVWSLRLDPAEATHDRRYKLRIFGRTKSRFLLTKQLRQALMQLPPETWVQLHSVYIPELTAIARLLKRRGISYGVTTHGGYLSLYFEPSRAARLKKKLFATLWENWMLRNAAMIHVIGVTELEDLQRRAPGQKMSIIPNGYAPEELDAGAGARREAQPASMVFCGRHVIKQKGLDLLLHGFACYRKSGGTLNLVLISRGKDTAYLHDLAARLGVAESVSWPGILPVNELRAMVAGATAFIHTSRFDVLPTACLEAAALGVPLLISSETNFAEYLLPRKAGWVCQPNVPDKIAEAMFTVQNTSPAQRLAMGENARRMISEELRWDLISLKFLQAVRECINYQNDAPEKFAGKPSVTRAL
jgi:glycosyltransferase involved in cell wall biosynthesis